MFFELIATVFAGLAAAGLVMLFNRVTGGRLPRWFMPVAAGAAMLAATVSSEYGWYGRTTSMLPEGVEVIETVENQKWYRPWTLAFPFVERFNALDRASLRTHPDQPGKTLADLYYYGRWAPLNRRSILTDCAAGRLAVIGDGVTIAEDGTITGLEWFAPGKDDPILTAICGGA
ncbi:MAG: hypothetical protein CSA70_12065 [Rhodobacterales bacterium]|nr:MAG: hypothetical protein CSA70_12065 [Rhodobacterales bacterium]